MRSRATILIAAGLDLGEQTLQPLDIHRLVEAVGNGLRHERMVRHFTLADQILGARHLVGEDRADQVLGHHAHELRRHLLAAAEARQRERNARDPAPARAEHRRIEQRLNENFAHRLRIEIARHLGEVEAVRGGERQNDVVFRRRRLQLEIELAAEALAEREAPGLVDAAAIGRMDHQLHAACLVEEALEDERLAGRQGAERAVGRAEIIDDLLGRRAIETEIAADPFQRVVAAVLEAAFELGSEARYRLGQLFAAGRRLAEPERDRRRLALRILHTHRAALHAHDAIGGVAELEDVALDALDGEVLVDRADHDVLGLEQHLEIGIVGDSAAGGDRREPCAAPPAQHAVDLVAMDQRTTPPAPRGEAVGKHA